MARSVDDREAGVSEGEVRPRSAFTRFIGIDLGGGRGKNTAVARLELSGGGPRLRLGVAEAKVRYGQRGTGLGADEPGGDALFRDEVLVAYLDRWVDEHTVVAVHAPLTLPPCIRCRLPCPTVERCTVPVVAWMRRWGPRLVDQRRRSDPTKPAVTPYTQRATEVLLAASGVRAREGLGQGTGPLAARAAYLRRAMSPRLRLHENLLEVDPKVTLIRRFGAEPERRARHGDAEDVWAVRKEMLTTLAEGIAFDYVWPELVVRNAHVFHAVVCAFTGFLWASRGWRGPADFHREHDKHEKEVDGRGDLVGEAARELGELWVDDGWIWSGT